MATTTIPWGDGSGDNIYLTCDALEGNQTVLVSSDANASASSRSQSVTFSTGGISQVLTVSQEPGILEPIFYNYLYFTRPAYIQTDYILPNLASFSTQLGHETVQAGTQRIFVLGSGTDFIRVQYASNTTAASGRRWSVYYGSSSNIGGNRTYAWSNNEFNFFLTPKRFGYGSNSYTITKGSGYPTAALRFGATEYSYSGRMSTFCIYDSSAQNATSYSALTAFTPVATFRPCTYGGQAGFWYVEGQKFFGNSADSGSLTASNE